MSGIISSTIRNFVNRTGRRMAKRAEAREAEAAKMHRIPRLHLNGTTDSVLKRYGPAEQKLQEILGKEETVFVTESQIPDGLDFSVEQELHAKHENMVTAGVKSTKSGTVFMPHGHGTNSRKDCVLEWTDQDAIELLHQWEDCGANMNVPQNVAKAVAYRGLLMPFTRQFAGGLWGPEHVMLCPEYLKQIKAIGKFIDQFGNFSDLTETTIPEFDGQAVFDPSPELIDKLVSNMDPEKAEKLREEIRQFKGGTARGPWTKELVVVGFHMRQCLKDMGVYEINGVPIDEIAIFGDISTFKASVGEGLMYEVFSQYAVAFHNLGHRYGLLLTNHGVRGHKSLPYQQLQAAEGCDKQYIQQGAEEEVAWLNAAADRVVAADRYIGGIIADLVKVDNKASKAWFVEEMAQQKHMKAKQEAQTGKTHDNSYMGFCVKDLIAFAQWFAVCAGHDIEVTGCLAPYRVLAPGMHYTGPAVASRNPVAVGYGLTCVYVVTHVSNQWRKYFDDRFNMIMTSIVDDLMTRSRGDQDGDKLFLTIVKWFVEAVKSLANREIADWNGLGTIKKLPVNEETLLNYYLSCTTQSQLGQNVSAIGKLIANGIIKTPEDQMVCDWAMNVGTDAKQGIGGLCGEAGKRFEELKKMAKDLPFTKSQAMARTLKGQSTKEKDINPEWTNSNCDIIARAVTERVPDRLPENQIEGDFDWKVFLMSDPKAIPGLIRKGTRSEGYNDCGFLNALIKRTNADWQAAAKAESADLEFRDMQKRTALDELATFAESNGRTIEDVYNLVVVYVFGSSNNCLQGMFYAKEATEGMKNRCLSEANLLVNWFGEMMRATYKRNTGVELVKQAYEIDENTAGQFAVFSE